MYARRSPRRNSSADRVTAGVVTKVIYRLVSTSRERVIESPFCLGGERIAAFYLEETALKMARILRESEKCPTVYGCYRQPNGTYLIGPASARPVGKYRQTLEARKVSGTVDASTEVWKNVTTRRILDPLDAFVRRCLRSCVSRSRR